VGKLLTKGESSAYKAGLLFDRIAKGQAYRERWGTLEAYAEAKFSQGFSTLKMYRRVAQAFSEKTVRKHGMVRLSAGLSYLDLLPIEHRAYDVLHLQIPVRAKEGKSVASVPFSKASLKQIERAIEDTQKHPAHDDHSASARLKRFCAELQQLVASPAGEHRHAPLARSHFTDANTVRFDLIGIDLDDVARVGEALVAFSLRHPASKNPERKARRSSRS
jgi:hypothetical protein